MSFRERAVFWLGNEASRERRAGQASLGAVSCTSSSRRKSSHRGVACPGAGVRAGAGDRAPCDSAPDFFSVGLVVYGAVLAMKRPDSLSSHRTDYLSAFPPSPFCPLAQVPRHPHLSSRISLSATQPKHLGLLVRQTHSERPCVHCRPFHPSLLLLLHFGITSTSTPLSSVSISHLF